MGQRHNRRRTRSRGYNKFQTRLFRREALEGLSLAQLNEGQRSTFSEVSPSSSTIPSTSPRVSLQLQSQKSPQEQNTELHRHDELERLEAEQRRLFGGEVGDEDLHRLSGVFEEVPFTADQSEELSFARIQHPISVTYLDRSRRSREKRHDAAYLDAIDAGAIEAEEEGESDEAWALLDWSTISDSGSEAWELLSGDDS
ncbi:MAG: hypothetical protein M1837_005362 [Sclerophora amabilis]|nr:MAG: hypothetical protein M1837_005362 [Sclerophora amabilis]